jgi:replication-associated recombination protein RarA
MWTAKDFENRYAPKRIDDIVFPNEQSRRLIDQLVSGRRPFPIAEGKSGILLHGIPGTGKSALAKLLPDAMEAARTGHTAGCDAVYERVLPGNNGMNMLSRISNHAVLMPYEASQHYYVLDEVDRLNEQAMQLLKSVMNTPGCVFVLTTNNLAAVEVGVRSRCHCIAFNAAPAADWLPLARRLISDAGLQGVSDQHLLAVIEAGKGSAREIIDALLDVVLDALAQER